MIEEQGRHFGRGVKDGIPIGLGYLSVSFTFGLMAVNEGLPVWAAVLTSMTNLTSAGQFAGLALMVSGGGFVEMALTQLVINLRYALMSLSWSQKIDPSVSKFQRALIAFGNTDEIFVLSSEKEGRLSASYLFGVMIMPYIGWALGTFIGGAASTLLPEFLRAALGIAIYGMFIAIIVPPAREQKPVRVVLAIAIICSCAFRYLPGLSQVSSGFVIIICTLLASAICAVLFPIDDEDDIPKKPTKKTVDNQLPSEKRSLKNNQIEQEEINV